MRKFLNQRKPDKEIISKNIKFLGLDLNLPVFFISSSLTILFSVLVLIYPEASNTILSDTRNFTLSWFDAFFSASMTAFTLMQMRQLILDIVQVF